MNCPHCNHDLTDLEIKRLWSAYCNARIPEEKRGGGAKPWKNHSVKAGLKCRCKDCNRLRQIRLDDLERSKAVKFVEPSPEDLTWDAMLTVNPQDGYEALIRHETNKRVASRKAKLKSKISQERFNLKMKLLRERAEKEKVWGKIVKEAKARADKRCQNQDHSKAS